MLRGTTPVYRYFTISASAGTSDISDYTPAL